MPTQWISCSGRSVIPLVAFFALVNGLCAQEAATTTQGIKYDASRLSSYSDEDLLALLSRESLDLNISSGRSLVWLGPTRETARGRTRRGPFSYGAFKMEMTFASDLPYPKSVVDELVRRRAYADLLQTFKTSPDELQLKWIEITLAGLRNAEVDSEMAALAKVGGGEQRGYLALLYFAETGAPWALAKLTCDYYKLPVPSLEKADVASLFGKHKYYPAARRLVGTLQAVSGNLFEAALESLSVMYPKGRTRFRSADDAAKYWTRFLADHPPATTADPCDAPQEP